MSPPQGYTLSKGVRRKSDEPIRIPEERNCQTQSLCTQGLGTYRYQPCDFAAYSERRDAHLDTLSKLSEWTRSDLAFLLELLGYHVETDNPEVERFARLFEYDPLFRRMFTILEQLGRDELQFAVEYLGVLEVRLSEQGEAQGGDPEQDENAKELYTTSQVLGECPFEERGVTGQQKLILVGLSLSVLVIYALFYLVLSSELSEDSAFMSAEAVVVAQGPSPEPTRTLRPTFTATATPTDTPTPTATPTVTPTFTPVPTDTPVPTATDTPKTRCTQTDPGPAHPHRYTGPGCRFPAGQGAALYPLVRITAIITFTSTCSTRKATGSHS